MSAPDVRPLLADAFNSRRNSLNALRLALALAVIVSHAWPLIGAHWEPNLGGMTLGGWAVAGFFAISGFLITRSRLRSPSASSYWVARALRIMPGLIVVLFVIAFVFAPLTAAATGREWSLGNAATYVLRDALLYPPKLYQATVGSTLRGLAYPVWDGSLWTLFWEGLCYLLIGFAGTVLRDHQALVSLAAIALILGTAVAVGMTVGVIPAHALGEPLREMITAMTSFAAGALLILIAHRIRVSALAVAAATLLLGLAILTQSAPYLSPIPIAFLLLVLGVRMPLHKVGAKYDISYGVYIYAWPVQQLVILIFGVALPVALSILFTLIGTVPLAYASCVFVERPALRLKRGASRSTGVPPVIPAS